MNFLSIESLTKDEILSILNESNNYKNVGIENKILKDKIVGLIFLEPSLRTRTRFSTAIYRLGGNIINVDCLKYNNNMSKSESLDDTVKILSEYCDILIIRSSESVDVDILKQSYIPIINAGMDNESHPCQTLVDLFAIKNKFNTIENLNIGIMTDDIFSRCTKSLLKSFDMFKQSEIRIITPNSKEIDLKNLHVLYVAGIPINDDKQIEYLDKRRRLNLTKDMLNCIGDDTIVLCPLPRIDEISKEVDNLKCSKYFQQSSDGQYVFMAILRHVVS